MTDAEEHGRKEPESLGALRLMLLDENSLDRAKRRLIEMHYRARVGHLGGNLVLYRRYDARPS